MFFVKKRKFSLQFDRNAGIIASLTFCTNPQDPSALPDARWNPNRVRWEKAGMARLLLYLRVRFRFVRNEEDTDGWSNVSERRVTAE
ncbi:MAG: hypothetical protein IJT94_08360, partial [Oscillibacter sp.]|nr:hypothetical protein [Oscillibacter sp.]